MFHHNPSHGPTDLAIAKCSRIGQHSAMTGPTSLVARYLPAVLVVLAASAPLYGAALRWDQTDISIDAAPMVESVEGVFNFTNTSTEPVTIAGVHSSCGCTVPELKKNTYAPGETGTIRAVFTLGDRTGLQEKTVTVNTSAPDATSTVLTLRVQIPKLFDVSPYFVIWNTGDALAARTIELRIHAPDVLALKSIESRHASFTASIAPKHETPGHYTITVAPSSTEQVTNGSINVVLATHDGQTRTVNLYALIRSAPAAKRTAASTTEPARTETKQ